MDMTCAKCSGPFRPLAEPPKANGFEFTLYGCQQCGHKEMYCVCTAVGTSGWEAVTDEDAAVILSGTHPNLADFMDAWQRKVIGA
jgi:hypothetical protein